MQEGIFMGKGKESPQPLVIRTALGVSAGAVIALVICLGLLAIAAAGIARGWLAEDWSGRITVAAALVGAFIGGVCGQRWYRHPLVGLGSGLVLCLILLAVGALLLDSLPTGGEGLGVLLAAAVGGGLAGLAARPRRKKKRR